MFLEKLFLFAGYTMKELCRNIHSSKIGYMHHGQFCPKIFYNFTFQSYVCNETVKVGKCKYNKLKTHIYVIIYFLKVFLKDVFVMIHCQKAFTILNKWSYYVIWPRAGKDLWGQTSGRNKNLTFLFQSRLWVRIFDLY